MQRYHRARHLIELGTLVQKSGLIDLLGDNQTTLLGAMLSLVTQAQSGDAHTLLAIWQRCGEACLRQQEPSRRDAASSHETSAT
jgi:Conjugal transfer protein TraD